MFSGLIETKGQLLGRDLKPNSQLLRFSFKTKEPIVIGESIAVNGACLTVVKSEFESFSAELSPETLQVTGLGQMQIGTAVNLERSLKVGDRIGGHFVLGHVDGQGKIVGIDRQGECYRVSVEIPQNLTRFAVDKGSIAIDGVSLTINKVLNNRVELMIIPHTWNETTMGDLNLKQLVNIEADYLAKIVAQQSSQGASVAFAMNTETKTTERFS